MRPPHLGGEPLTLSLAEDLTDGAGLSAGWRRSYWWGGRSLPSNGELQFFAEDADPLLQARPDLQPLRLTADGLVIRASRSPNPDATGGLPFVSGLINSHGRFAQKHGYFEISLRPAPGQGLLSAFWLLPASGAWPPEIDVVEVLGSTPDRAFGSLHIGLPQAPEPRVEVFSQRADLTGRPHDFGLLWTARELSWWIDGQQVGACPAPPELDEPMYLLAGLMVGGEWAGPPPPETRFPAEMIIRAIRAYRLPEAA